MKHFSVFILIILLAACSEDESQVKDMRGPDVLVEDEYPPDNFTEIEAMDTVQVDSLETQKLANSEWSYEVTFLSEGNWGYQIFQKGDMVINQTSIPSIQGIDGFDSEQKAERTAVFILNKVENGIFPPTVNKKDLETLGVLRD